MLIGVIVLIYRHNKIQSLKAKALDKRNEMDELIEKTDKLMNVTYIQELTLKDKNIDKNITTLEFKQSFNKTEQVTLLANICGDFDFKIGDIKNTSDTIMTYLEKGIMLLVIMHEHNIVIACEDFELLYKIRNYINDKVKNSTQIVKKERD